MLLNYVICEKGKNIAQQTPKEIEKFMMAYDIDYKVTHLSYLSKEWLNFIRKEDGFKIYIFLYDDDLKETTKAIFQIRQEIDDWVSMIIVCGKSSSGASILNERLLILDYIEKCENNLPRFQNDLKICLKSYDNRYKKLRYTYKNTIYNLEFRQIIFIEKELDTKRCLINTLHGTYYINGSINQVSSLLDNRFIKCYRSLIINLEQVESYDLKTNTITFKDKSKINTISRDKKKLIVNYLRGLSK